MGDEIVIADAGIIARPIAPRGDNGSRRGHIWVDSAVRAFRCEGIDPWARRPRYAPGHRDIDMGERFLKKLWAIWSPSGKTVSAYRTEVSSRHCEACAKEIGASDED